jgi:sorting nexin-29
VWFDEECKLKINEKNRLRKLYLERNTRTKRQAYEDARREANKMLRKKKRTYMNNILLKMEEDFVHNNTREAYKAVNVFKKGFKPNTNLCKDRDGNIIADPENIKHRWKEYSQEVLNPDGLTDSAEPEILLEDGQEVDTPSLTEVKRAIKKLKNNKTPGVDNLPSELFKYGNEHLHELLHGLIAKIWELEKIPEEWQMSIICPIHKKGDKLKCENHRGISLLSTAYKLLTSILKERLEPYAEEIIGKYQAGFRRGRSTSDQLFTVRQILTKCWEFDVDIHQLFIDFRQAYDSIRREKLYDILSTFGIPTKLIRATMCRTKCKVKIGAELTDELLVGQGLKQGDGLAPTLFNLCLEYVVRKTYFNNTNPNIYFQSSQIVGYADDLNIVGRSLTAVREVFDPLETAAKEVGLQINESKTKIMKQSRSPNNNPQNSIQLKDTYNIETVDEFTYLGSTITNGNEDHVEIKRRIATGNKAFFSLLPVLKSRSVHRKTKITLYKTIIRTVVTYGCEAWAMTAKSAEMLDTFERRVLRKILGPVNDGEYASMMSYTIFTKLPGSLNMLD